MTEPQRNDPCPCGSGKKFKNCCLTADLQDAGPSDENRKKRSLALKKMGERKWDEAIALFKSIEDPVDDAFDVFQAIASCYEGLDDFLRAAEYYEKAAAACPESKLFELTYRLGVARACAGRLEKAREAFEKCLDSAKVPEHRDGLMKLITAIGDILDGKQNPNVFSVNVALQRAFTDLDEERYEEAADRLEKIISLDPENPAIFYNLAVVYTFLKREDEALLLYEKTLRINPSYVQAWYNMGQICLIKNNDASRALTCFDRALALRPDYIGAHHQRGVAWAVLGDKDKALQCWEKTLELDPGNKMAAQSIEKLRGGRRQ